MRFTIKKAPDGDSVVHRASAVRVTTYVAIEALGSASSDEAHYVLRQHDGRLWVGNAADQSESGVEAYGVSAAYLMCDKLIAKAVSS